MSEIWKPIPGYEGLYEVSDGGSVRSLTRSHDVPNPISGVPMTRTVKGRRKALNADRYGYYRVRLCKNGRAKSLLVSRLVLMAFVGEGDEACHINHCKTDNSLANLRWGTRLENEQQKTASGRRPVSTRGVLTPTIVKEIRQLREKHGLTYKQIAAKIGVHFSTVWYVIQKKIWGWVE